MTIRHRLSALLRAMFGKPEQLERPTFDTDPYLAGRQRELAAVFRQYNVQPVGQGKKIEQQPDVLYRRAIVDDFFNGPIG